MTPISIDLNADLGESYGTYTYGHDEALLKLVTSCNIACGYHGGDPATLRRAVHLAKEGAVTIGAHPGYPDLLGFGRRHLAMTPSDITDMLLYQMGALDGICRAEGTHIRYVKPHGALYNDAAKDAVIAGAIVRALRLYDPQLTLLCPLGSRMETAAREAGIPVVLEFFADRGYQADGSLAPRSLPGAVLSDASVICERVLKALMQGTVSTLEGTELPVTFHSVCLHGDNPAAVQLATTIREALTEAGIQIRSFA